MKGRIDFHCHILPGADHGSASVQEAVSQVALQKQYGIEKIVATPHFYPDIKAVKAFLEMRNRCADLLVNALPSDAPEIYLGAEVLVCNQMEQMEDLEKLCIEGTRFLLLEMPFARLTDRLYYTIDNLTKRKDICIVLAHIDRYDCNDIRSIMNLPVLAQVNAESLRKRSTREELEEFFMLNRVVALGTDLHGADHKIMKNYEKGLSKLGSYNEEEIYRSTEKLLENAVPLNRH